MNDNDLSAYADDANDDVNDDDDVIHLAGQGASLHGMKELFGRACNFFFNYLPTICYTLNFCLQKYLNYLPAIFYPKFLHEIFFNDLPAIFYSKFLPAIFFSIICLQFVIH